MTILPFQRPETKNDSGYVYLFLHIPKCMGSTLTNALTEQVRHAAHIFKPGFTRKQTRELVHKKMKEQGSRPADLRVIYGHTVFEGLHTVSPRQPRYFTFLREPVARKVSLYNYFRMIIDQKDHWRSDHYRDLLTDNGKLLEFPDWIEVCDTQRNTTMRFVAHASYEWNNKVWPPDNQRGLAMAKGLLSRMHYVGFVEHSDTDLELICRELGIRTPKRKQNVSPDYFKLDPQSKLAQRVRDINERDMELYEFAMQCPGAPRRSGIDRLAA